MGPSRRTIFGTTRATPDTSESPIRMSFGNILSTPQTAPIDSNGNFELGGVSPGNYKLWANGSSALLLTLPELLEKLSVHPENNPKVSLTADPLMESASLVSKED